MWWHCRREYLPYLVQHFWLQSSYLQACDVNSAVLFSPEYARQYWESCCLSGVTSAHCHQPLCRCHDILRTGKREKVQPRDPLQVCFPRFVSRNISLPSDLRQLWWSNPITKQHVCMSCLELSHWQVPKGRVYQLEATAYALLALVKVKVSEDKIGC